MFSQQSLYCSICGTAFKASVGAAWQAFDKAVCGQRCFHEKEWRRTLSIMGNEYREDPREYNFEDGSPKNG